MQNKGLQLIEEKREIARILSYDENIVNDIMSQYKAVSEKYADNPALLSFVQGGFWFVTAFYEFILPYIKMILFLDRKYPHAQYLFCLKRLTLFPQEASKVKWCANPWEVYEALSKMSVYDAQCVLENISDIPAFERVSLCNALYTKDVDVFLECFSSCQISDIFLKSIAIVKIQKETNQASLKLFDLFLDSFISGKDFEYGVQELTKLTVIKSCNTTERENILDDANEIYSRLSELFVILKQCKTDETEAFQYVIEKGYNCHDWENVFRHISDTLIFISLAYQEFVNDLESNAINELLLQRDGKIKIDNIESDGHIISIRNLVDALLAEYSEDDDVENGSVEASAVQIDCDSSSLTPVDESFVDCFMQPNAPLTYPYLLRIAQALGNAESKKQYLRTSDIPTFCWFFNNGVNGSNRQIDFRNKIKWLGDIGSLKHLIKLLYSKPKNLTETTSKQNQLPNGTSKCVLSVFEFVGKRSTRSTDGQYAKQTFNNAHATRGDRDMLNEIVVPLLPWDVKSVK